MLNLNARTQAHKSHFEFVYHYHGQVKSSPLMDPKHHPADFSRTNTCRTCLQYAEDASSLYLVFDMFTFEVSGKKSFDLLPINLLEQLQITSLKMSTDDGLPQHICSDCMLVLTGLQTFRDTCSLAQVTLSQYFAKCSDADVVTEVEQIQEDEKVDTQPSGALVEYVIEEAGDASGLYDVNFDDYESGTGFGEALDAISEYHDIEELAENDFKDEQIIETCSELGADSEEDITNHESLAIKILEDTSEKGSEGAHKSYDCPICKKSFTSISNRNIHVQSHNEKNTYKCYHCTQGFKSKVYLSKHIRSMHMPVDHECPHCLQHFDSTIKFEYHLKSHAASKKFECSFCDKSFLQQHHLDNHERTHTGVKPYLCSVCGKDFKQESNLKLHQRIHNNVRPYACNVCGKDFIQRGSFVLHMRQHTNYRQYQCEHCGKGFSQKSSLTVHLRTHTGERPFKCFSCDKAYAQSQQLKLHLQTAHDPADVRTPAISTNAKPSPPVAPPCPNPSKPTVVTVRFFPYTCDVCNKGFKLPSSLSTHMKVHTEERKHVCNDCGNTFKRAEHLRIHINGVHLKKKPYACPSCPCTFAQSGDRNTHMRRHTNEKPHECSYCQKSFRLPKALKAHVRIHTGEKPYKCEICGDDFMTYTALASHTLKHNVPTGARKDKRQVSSN